MRALWGLPAMGGKRMARRPRKMSLEHILVEKMFTCNMRCVTIEDRIGMEALGAREEGMRCEACDCGCLEALVALTWWG